MHDLFARWRCRPYSRRLVLFPNIRRNDYLFLYAVIIFPDHYWLRLCNHLLYQLRLLLLQPFNLLLQICYFLIVFYFQFIKPIHGLIILLFVLLFVNQFLDPALELLHLLVNVLKALRHFLVHALAHLFYIFLQLVEFEGAYARLRWRWLIGIARGFRRRARPNHLGHLILELSELLRKHIAHCIELFFIYVLAFRKADFIVNELGYGALVHEVGHLVIYLLNLLLKYLHIALMCIIRLPVEFDFVFVVLQFHIVVPFQLLLQLGYLIVNISLLLLNLEFEILSLLFALLGQVVDLFRQVICCFFQSRV